MSTQALYSMPEPRSQRELGSMGELRPGLRYTQPAQLEPAQADDAPASGAWLWAVAVAIAVAAAALRAFS